MNFTFEIVSPKYGRFTVTAPLRFKERIEALRWHVLRDPTRVPGREFSVVSSHIDRDGKKRHLSLHRFVMDLAGCAPAQVDHADRNPLNNSEDNLRDGSGCKNHWNRGLLRTNKSGAIGVSWFKALGKWQATVAAHGRQRHVGFFVTKEEAIAARDVIAKRMHGEFAVVNGVTT